MFCLYVGKLVNPSLLYQKWKIIAFETPIYLRACVCDSLEIIKSSENLFASDPLWYNPEVGFVS